MRNKEVVKDLAMIALACVLCIIGLVVYEHAPIILLPLVIGGNTALVTLIDAFSFIPLGMIVMGKLESRKDSLTAFCVIGILYVLSGDPELLLFAFATVFISGLLRFEKMIFLGFESIVTALVLSVCGVVLFRFTGRLYGRNYTIGTILWMFGICFICSFICEFLTRKNIIADENFDDEITINNNYRKRSINSKFMIVINLFCAIIIIASAFFTYALLTSQAKSAARDKDFLLQSVLANELAAYGDDIKNGDAERMEEIGAYLAEKLSGTFLNLPANIVVAVRPEAGADYVQTGYYLVEYAENSVIEYNLYWVEKEQELSSLILFMLVPESEDVAIEVLTTPELAKDNVTLLKQIFGALLVIMIAINLIAQSMVFRTLVKPINGLTTVAIRFAYDNKEHIEESKEELERLAIQSGDEVESLYTSLMKTMSSMTDYIGEVKETSAKIADMQHNVIVTMADIIESRDENTGGHIKRTAVYVQLIAEKLREKGLFKDTLTDDYVKNMVVAAPLHDMGKIHVPDAILNKPGRLDDEEFAIMKSHASAGKEMLVHASDQIGTFEYLDIALKMAGSHHEWWNGNGYPEKISGEDIPLCARIMAVADVFDALVSKRCYKPGMPLEKAIGIIKEETGTHFDPVVAEAFLECIDDVEKVMNEND